MQLIKTISLFILFIVFLFIGCRSNDNWHNQGAIDSTTSYYETGELKNATQFKNNKRHGFSYTLAITGDTLEQSMYENDSIVYKIEFDSLGNKTSDIRKIHSSLPSENFTSGDTIRVKFWIEGPYTENIYLIASAHREYPDTSIRFKKYLEQKSVENQEQFTFIPDKQGIYNVKMYGVENKIRKIIGEIRINIEVE